MPILTFLLHSLQIHWPPKDSRSERCAVLLQLRVGILSYTILISCQLLSLMKSTHEAAPLSYLASLEYFFQEHMPLFFVIVPPPPSSPSPSRPGIA